MKPLSNKPTPVALARWLGAGLLGTATALAVAQAPAVRLGAVLDMARASDAQYAAAQAAASAGREKQVQGQAGLRPSINFSYAVRRNRDRSTAYPDARAYDGGGGSLNISQPLFRIANKVVAEQGELQSQLAEQQLQLAEQDLLVRVAKAYFDVLQGQDDLAAAGAQKVALVQQLAQVNRSLEVGTVPITDLNESQSRHDLAVAQEIAARNELESKRRVLEKIIARPMPVLARLLDAANTDVLSAQIQQELVDSAATGSRQVALAHTSSLIAAKEVSKQDAGHQPTLDLVASQRLDRNPNISQFGGSTVRQASIGVELNMPLYAGGAISSRAREAVAELARAQQEELNAARQALLDAQQAQLGAQSGSALTSALRQAVSSSEALIRSTQRGLQVGVRTRVDVLNAEQQLYATRKDLAAARYRTLVSTVQLKAAAGVLAEDDLRQLDALLAE